MIGSRPKPIPGKEPGRWRVVRARRAETSFKIWYVARDGCTGRMWFITWREALAYADRRAREKTIVLPRPRTREWDGIAFDFSEFAGLDYQPCMGDIALYQPGKAFASDFLIPRENWKPLAGALWPLAEMEDRDGR